MKIWILRLIVFVAVCLPARAQQSSAGPAALHVKSRIVVVDVVVTDSRGNAVHDLKAHDFSLLEDKQAQTIRHFEEHTAASSATPLPAQPALPPNTFTNIVTAPEGSALNIIVLDSLNTPIEEQANLRAQLKAIVDALPAGTRVAVFGITNRLLMLQSFTSNPAVLKAALTHRQGILSAASLQAGSAAPAGMANQLMTMSLETGTYEATAYNAGSPLALFDRRAQSFALRERAELTLAALHQLTQYLAALPGRKNLIWASGSFAISYGLDVSSMDTGSFPFDSSVDFSKELRQVSIEMARSQVAVYPVSAHALTTDTGYSASVGSTMPGAQAVDPMSHQRQSMQASLQLLSEQATMLRIADETGGHAFVNTNDISGSVIKAINMGANYYTLTYVPTNSNWDGKTRKIKVELNSKNYKLSYRTSYIASENPVTVTNQQSTPESERTAVSTLVTALRRGAPDPTEIVFSIHVSPSMIINPPANTPKTSPSVEKLSAVSLKAQRRYRIDYSVDPQDVNWQLQDGNRSATLEFMIIGYDNDSQILNQVSRTVPLHLSEQDFAQASHGGLRLRQELAMPAKGEYYLRAAVMDKSNNHIGTVEVSTVTLENPK